MKTKTRNILLIIVGALVVLYVLHLLFGGEKEYIVLDTGTVTTMNISSSVTATGTLEPVDQVEIGTQVSGIIDKLFVDYNDQVKAGQVIALMDKVTLEAEYNTSLLQVESSKIEYEYQKKEYERVKGLYEKELVSEQEYDSALYTYQMAKNTYEQSKISLIKVKQNLDYATITSPIDGIVISRAVEEGETVAAGFSTPTLFTIVNDLTKMQVIADIDEADIGQVLEGQRVEFTVDAYPDDTFYGEVTQVRLEATTESNVVTYEVVISADNSDLKLKPGLTANVTVYTLEVPNATTVPTKALKFSPNPETLAEAGYGVDLSAGESSTGKRVWVVEGDRLSAVDVTVGTSTGDRTQVEGIEPGKTVALAVSSETSGEKKAEKSAAGGSPFMPGPGR